MLCQEPLTRDIVKKLLLTAALLLLSVVPAFAAKPAPENFNETLSKATVAVYAGKDMCGYKTVDTPFGTLDVWSCEFKTQFVCTGTVIRADERGTYAGLTAGHCFDYDIMDKGVKYYVAEGLSKEPVLNEIHLIKFEADDRYDYAVFQFHSLHQYPVIDFQKSGGTPALGTEILNANYSLGVTKQVLEGKVVSAQIGADEGGRHCSDCAGRYFVGIGVGPGASGSAVVDAKTHQIVGLVEAVFPETQMATIVMPMGDTFIHFMDDDSAGIRHKSAPNGTEIKYHETPAPPPPTLSQLLSQLAVKVWEAVTTLLKNMGV